MYAIGLFTHFIALDCNDINTKITITQKHNIFSPRHFHPLYHTHTQSHPPLVTLIHKILCAQMAEMYATSEYGTEKCILCKKRSVFLNLFPAVSPFLCTPSSPCDRCWCNGQSGHRGVTSLSENRDESDLSPFLTDLQPPVGGWPLSTYPPVRSDHQDSCQKQGSPDQVFFTQTPIRILYYLVSANTKF